MSYSTSPVCQDPTRGELLHGISVLSVQIPTTVNYSMSPVCSDPTRGELLHVVCCLLRSLPWWTTPCPAGRTATVKPQHSTPSALACPTPASTTPTCSSQRPWPQVMTCPWLSQWTTREATLLMKWVRAQWGSVGGLVDGPVGRSVGVSVCGQWGGQLVN